jgi:hypothetical protein
LSARQLAPLYLYLYTLSLQKLVERVMKYLPKTSWLLVVLVLWGTAVFTTTHAAVGLEYFRAENDPTNVVKLTWKTGYEDSIIGYRIRRSDQPLPPLSVLFNGTATTLVISSPENAFGATYTVYDPNAVTGTTYTYKLYEVLNNNTEAELESATLTVGGSSAPTNTPTVGPSATPTATATQASGGGGTATVTPTPTVTPLPTIASATATVAPTTAAGSATPTATPSPAPTALSTTATNSTGGTGGTTGTSGTGSTTGTGGTTGTTGTGSTGTETQPSTAPSTGGTGVAEASTNPEETNQEEYPPQLNPDEGEERPEVDESGNPIAPLEQPTSAEPTAYPEGETPAETTTTSDPTAEEGYIPPTIGGGTDTTIPSIGSGQNGGSNTPLPPPPPRPYQRHRFNQYPVIMGWLRPRPAHFPHGGRRLHPHLPPSFVTTSDCHLVSLRSYRRA